MSCYKCFNQGEIIDKRYLVCKNCELIIYEKPKPKKFRNKITHLNNLLRKLQYGSTKQTDFIKNFRVKNKDFRLSYEEIENINELFREYTIFVGVKNIFTMKKYYL